MKVVVFAASKGGVGKTTLVHNVAVHAAGLGHEVLIADLDPQQSLRKVWEKRRELVNPRLVSNVGKVAESVALLRSAGYDKEFIFIDTPGSIFPIIRDAVSAADLVVLPTRPSSFDLTAQEDVTNVVEEEGKLSKALFVLTQAETGKAKAAVDLLEKSEKFIKARAKYPVVIIPRRLEYARAAETGAAGYEIDKKCRADIATLWDAMLEVMRRPTTRETEQADVRKLH